MAFVIAFLVSLIFWVFLWKVIKRGTETLEDILVMFERNRR